MRWVSAALVATYKGVTESARRVLDFLLSSTKNALKRPAVLPVAAGAAIGLAFVSPWFAAGLAAIMVNDPGAHPVIRMAWDILAIVAVMGLVALTPWAAIPLAVLPVADLINRWIDSVQRQLDSWEQKDAERMEDKWVRLFGGMPLPESSPASKSAR